MPLSSGLTKRDRHERQAATGESGDASASSTVTRGGRGEAFGGVKDRRRGRRPAQQPSQPLSSSTPEHGVASGDMAPGNGDAGDASLTDTDIRLTEPVSAKATSGVSVANLPDCLGSAEAGEASSSRASDTTASKSAQTSQHAESVSSCIIEAKHNMELDGEQGSVSSDAGAGGARLEDNPAATGAASSPSVDASAVASADDAHEPMDTTHSDDMTPSTVAAEAQSVVSVHVSESSVGDGTEASELSGEQVAAAMQSSEAQLSTQDGVGATSTDEQQLPSTGAGDSGCVGEHPDEVGEAAPNTHIATASENGQHDSQQSEHRHEVLESDQGAAADVTEMANAHVSANLGEGVQTVGEQEESPIVAVDEEGRIIATGAEAERLIAEHQQALQEQQERAQAAVGDDSMSVQTVSHEDQMYQAAVDRQMIEAATGCADSQEPQIASDLHSVQNQQQQQPQPGDILQQAFEAASDPGGVVGGGSSCELTPGELVEQAVAQVHGGEETDLQSASSGVNTTNGTIDPAAESTAESGQVAVGVEQHQGMPKDEAQQENKPPLGSCDNPIQIIQQGNSYHSTQTLSPEQLHQIAQVLQQQQVAKAIQNGGSAVVYNPQTNTRIIYRVIYPGDNKDNKKSLTRPGGSSAGVRSTTINVAGASRGVVGKPPKMAKVSTKNYRGRGRPSKKFDDDINPEGPALSKEEREALKRQVPRTRSGRISRPPKYMVRDYKRIHHLDFHEEPPPDESDGGYSDIDGTSEDTGEDGVKHKRRKLLVGADLSFTGKLKAYRCSQCDRAYISAVRLRKHFRLTEHGDPENLPPPINVEEIVQSEEEMDYVAGEAGRKGSQHADHQDEAKPKPQSRSYADMVSTRRKNRLRELLRTCTDAEVLDVCLHRVAQAATMWQFLLAKSEDGDPPVPDVPLMLVNLETLLQQTERLGKEFLFPTTETEGDDLVELVDEMVAAALGNKDLGTYRVAREAYYPEMDFLIKPHPIYQSPMLSARHRPATVGGAAAAVTGVPSVPASSSSFSFRMGGGGSSHNLSTVSSSPNISARPVAVSSHGTSSSASSARGTRTILQTGFVGPHRPTSVTSRLPQSSTGFYGSSNVVGSLMPTPAIMRRTGSARSYLPQPQSVVTMSSNRSMTPNILSTPKPHFRVFTTTPRPAGSSMAGNSKLYNYSSGNSLLRKSVSGGVVCARSGGSITRVTPQSVRGTSVLGSMQSVTPAQHIQHITHEQQVQLQRQHQHSQAQQQQQLLQQQLIQQQQQQQQQEQMAVTVQQQHVAEEDEVSLVVGQVYEDENGQPIVINEDGTVTPVSLQHVVQDEGTSAIVATNNTSVVGSMDIAPDGTITTVTEASPHELKQTLHEASQEFVEQQQSQQDSQELAYKAEQDDEELLQQGAALEQAILQDQPTQELPDESENANVAASAVGEDGSSDVATIGAAHASMVADTIESSDQVTAGAINGETPVGDQLGTTSEDGVAVGEADIVQHSDHQAHVVGSAGDGSAESLAVAAGGGQSATVVGETGATTEATVTAVIGEGDATVALALTPDPVTGQLLKQIVLADGQVLGTCMANGELSLSDGVQLLQQQDDANSLLLQPVHGNIQVPIETVRALLSMELQNVVVQQQQQAEYEEGSQCDSYNIKSE